MSVDASTMQRLAFVQYMYRNALEQSRQPEPLSYASILTFHDAVELFLQLAAERLNVASTKPGKAPWFMEYWTLFAQRQPPVPLSQQATMEKLNDLRRDFKHYFKLPHPLTLDAIRGNVTDFFSENTPLVFGIAFDTISMLSLIQYDTGRTRLEQAVAALEMDDTLLAMDMIAVAFAEMLREFEERIRSRLGRSSFGFQTALEQHKSRVGGFSAADREIQRGLQQGMARDNALIDSVLLLQEPMRIISLGLDYRRYVKFRLLSPRPKFFLDSQDRDYRVTANEGRTPPTREECRFCMDFVIESAIRLMDYETFLVT